MPIVFENDPNDEERLQITEDGLNRGTLERAYGRWLYEYPITDLDSPGMTAEAVEAIAAEMKRLNSEVQNA